MSIQQKIYIKITVTLLLILVVGVFLFSSLLNDLEETSHNFNAKKSELESLLVKDVYLDSLTGDYSLVKDNIQILRDYFLASNRPIDFIKDVERIASETGNVEEIRVLSYDQIGQSDSFNFQVSLYGDFQGLMKFLTRLENGKYYSSVTGLNISRLSEIDLFGRLKDIPGIEIGDINSVLSVRVYTL